MTQPVSVQPGAEIISDMTRTELIAREHLITRGKRAFEDVGAALAEIRERRGYRFNFKTFDDYCDQRWGWSRQTAAYYIGAAEVVKAVPELSTQVDITHARELSRLVKPHAPGALTKDKRRKELDVEAVREVAATVDLKKTTVKQITAVVDEKIKEQKRARRNQDLDAQAAAWQLETAATKPNKKRSAGASNQTHIQIICADSTNLRKHIADETVDLIVTSPPYNQGIKYHQHKDNMKPGDYERMIMSSLTQAHRILKPGGRIALVIPGGVGRNPYVPFASQFQRRLSAAGFTLFGEIVWDKGRSASGSSIAVGSFRSSVSPSLHDQTERIEIAYKDSPRMNVPKEFLLRDEKGTYTPYLQDANGFLGLIRDLWQGAPESDPRIGHPAPFPVWLPRDLIRLLAYPTATIADLWGGSGSTMVAAQELGCNGIYVDIDPAYCALTQARVGKGKS